jgi:16S rRNA (cytosine967-C5)-methyltransferase
MAEPRHGHARLRQASEALGAMLSFAHPADQVLDLYYKEHRQMGGRDRRECAEIVYGALRHKRRLAHWIDSAGLPHADAQALAGAWLLHGGGWTPEALDQAGFTYDATALAAAIAAAPAETLPFATRWSLPDALAARLQAQYGAEAEALARALLEQAPVDLRVNLLRSTRDALAERLRAAGIESIPTPQAATGLRLTKRAALSGLPEFKRGMFELQDEGSQLIGELLAPAGGERVLDLCAGAGGKSLQLAAAMGDRGTVWACDVDPRRLGRASLRITRSGATCIATRELSGLDDAWLAEQRGTFDAVLVDAPCSGSGTLRRNPDLKWRTLDLEKLGALQRKLLSAGLALAKPGGRVVYATCSLLREENEAIVEACGVTPDETLVRLPHRDGGDGYYAARSRVA